LNAVFAFVNKAGLHRERGKEEGGEGAAWKLFLQPPPCASGCLTCWRNFLAVELILLGTKELKRYLYFDTDYVTGETNITSNPMLISLAL